MSARGDYPLAYEVTRVRRETGGEDELGNDVMTTTREAIAVFGWWYTSPEEPMIARHERVAVDVSLIAAVGSFRPSDAVELPGDPEHYEVVGYPQNYDNNPWWSPGREVVTLAKIEG